MRKCLIYGGLLLIAASLCLTGFYVQSAEKAADNAKRVMEQLETVLPKSPDHVLQEEISFPEGAMPEVEVEGNLYIGMVSIPSFELSLPVMSSWDYSKLKISPCCYSGCVYQDNMIIAAHNYPRHFGDLKNLRVGDEVFFWDAAGNQFAYVVTELEELKSNAVEEMAAGDWDLTLFTCTPGGRKRVTVRCTRTEK